MIRQTKTEGRQIESRSGRQGKAGDLSSEASPPPQFSERCGDWRYRTIETEF